jgi:hypothetical protein
MQSPYSNPMLSLRAKGMFAMFVEVGRVLSVDEMWGGPVPEGRDAITNAMKELKVAGYIQAVKVPLNGQFRTYLKFTDKCLNMLSDERSKGFSIHGVMSEPETDFQASYSPDREIVTSTSISTSNSSSLKVLRTFNLSGAPKSEGGSEMGWDLDGDEPQKPVKKLRTADTDDEVGAVGRVEDRMARINAKYKPNKTRDSSVRREDRAEETWGSVDLVAEFYMLVEQHAPGVPGQVNSRSLVLWINQKVGEGVTRYAILKAIRKFFNDPRLVREAGFGEPLWRKFVAYYPTVHGVVSRVAEDETISEDMESHREKMLRILGGKSV